MTILVTGCMGFIGSNLVPRLLNAGYDVVGIDSMTNPSPNARERIEEHTESSPLKKIGKFSFYQVDITDGKALVNTCADKDIKAVIHLAAVGSVPRSFVKPEETIMANEFGFANVVQLTNVLRVKKLIFASSSSVYGQTADAIKVEGLEGQVMSPYALSKQMNEKLAIILCPLMGITFVGLRFFNVYGPGQRSDSMYSAVIPKFICEEKPIVYGDGENARDFTYVADVCQSMIRSLMYDGGSCIVNVCTGASTKLNDLLNYMGKREVASYHQPRPGDIRLSVGYTDNARHKLGFVATHTIRMGLEKTVRYYAKLGLAKGALV